MCVCLCVAQQSLKFSKNNNNEDYYTNLIFWQSVWKWFLYNWNMKMNQIWWRLVQIVSKLIFHVYWQSSKNYHKKDQNIYLFILFFYYYFFQTIFIIFMYIIHAKTLKLILNYFVSILKKMLLGTSFISIGFFFLPFIFFLLIIMMIKKIPSIFDQARYQFGHWSLENYEFFSAIQEVIFL